MADRWLYAWGGGSIAFGGASLLIPLYLVELGATAIDLGVLAATAAVIGAPGAILFGRVADRVDRRRSLVLLTLAIVATVLAAVPFLRSITAVIVANAALWLVVASVAPVLTMLVIDDAPEPKWGEHIGRLNTFQGYGWAGGLVVGTAWPVLARPVVGPGLVTQSLFWVLAACAGVSTALAVSTLPRPDAHVTSERKVRRVARLLSGSKRGIKGATFVFSPNRLYWTTRGMHPRRFLEHPNPTLLTYFAAAGLFFTGFAAFWAPLPLFLTGVGFPPGQVFGLYLVSSLASAVCYGVAGTVTTRYDVRLVQSASLAGRGLLFPAIAVIAGLGVLALKFGVAAVGLIAIGVTWALIAVVGTTIVTRLAARETRVEALGIHTALVALAGGLGSILGGWAATLGYLVAFGLAGGLVVLGAGVVLSLRPLSTTAAAGETG